MAALPQGALLPEAMPLLRLSARFEPAKEVAPWLAAGPGDSGVAEAVDNYLETLHTVNVERNGNIIYTWKGNQGYTHIGLYDHHTEKNQHLYTFEKDLQVISCSVNSEKTLLAVSFLQSAKEERVNLVFQPVSKCLTLLIEIHPVNNVKVLKAVDSCIRVQFLYPVAETHSFLESCLLLISEDKYAEKIDIRVVKDGQGVVIANSSQLSRERIADDLIWAQWDMMEQRLFYIVPKESLDTLNCIQFFPDKNFKLTLEAPLDISLADIALKLMNLDYNCHQDREIIPKPLNIRVITNETGCLCICYSLIPVTSEEVTYSVLFLHKGYSKTYTVALDEVNSLEGNDLTFLNLDYYVAIYLPGHFLHLLNTRHPDLMCYSFFLTGGEAKINGLHASTIISPLKSTVFDRSTGELFTIEINKEALFQFLWNSKCDTYKLAALHCLLLHIGSTREIESQVIQWILDKTSICFTFDPMQEFIIASSYWTMCLDVTNLDKLLPYTPLLQWNEDFPGIICRTHIISMPALKVQHCKDFWEKLSMSLECVKYSEPYLHFNYKMLQKEWDNLLSEERTEERTTYMKNIFGNAKRVFSSLNMSNVEGRLVPFFQDEDNQQQLLTGLMVAQLKDHLARHLQYIGTKNMEQIAVDYVSKLLRLIWQIMESVWKKYNLQSHTFSIKGQGNSQEVAAFHIMCRILQATNGMCMPLPPGFHTLLMGLGVRCLPLHTFLHYIDHGVLHLTEMNAIKLLKELDDTVKNEKLKLSILTRLPEEIGHKICHIWSHPARSNAAARNYVKFLLEKCRNKQHRMLVVDGLSARIEFLPLNYLINILAEVECQGWAASVQPENMNVRLVEELALKHTTMLLGL